MISTLKEAYQQNLEQNDLIKNVYVSITNKNIL